jgi:ArsR family transcriptional regulator
MSITVTQDRLERLIDAGLRGSCRPAERTIQLKRRLKDVDTIAVARLEQAFFGLADKTRLMILELLAKEELCECEITTALGVSQPNTSHHLGILERAGLIISRREGKWVFYRVAPITKVLMSKASALVKGT